MTGGPRGMRGFTLVELLVIVTILGVLAALSWPAYDEHMRRARRVDAETLLVELSQFMERYYTAHHRYTDAAGKAPTLPITAAPTSGSTKYYDLDLAAVTADTYTLRATPRDTQASDRCGTLTLTNAAEKAGAQGDCWGR